MRTLVACPKCNRQYDAEGLSVGKKFHCHCGAVLKVSRPKGLDASVVCCSSCGAPRMKGALACEHCDADFTLHERDMHTVCPHCAARVSDKARFCHHCGKSINPEMVAGEESALCCPVCDGKRQLASRAWGEISILECNRCAGMWLGHESFHYALTQAGENRQRAGWTALRKARPGNVEAPPPDGGRRYRPCAECGELMPKTQFSASGVVIDQCKHHGVWFDADELARILDWIHQGHDAEHERHQAAENAEAEKAKRREEALMGRKKRAPANPWTNDGGSESLLEEAIRWLFRV
jgi:Zn-finger nucleic acid-binding protein